MFRAMKHVFIVNPAAGKFDRTEGYRAMIDAANRGSHVGGQKVPAAVFGVLFLHRLGRRAV